MADKVGGWVGKILRVDLTTGRIWTVPSLEISRKFIGARGVAARIAWEEMPPGIKPFDPENLLFFGVGPLTGTSAPNAARTTVCSLSPQGYPYEWFSYSSFGGFWGPMLKYAGYDMIIVQGKSDRPVYLWIDDDRVELRDASDLWGQGLFHAQEVLMERHGDGTRVLAIGQAGENLVRIATIATGHGSAAGQGGFGAVMGSKRLKAIAVHGTKGIPIARPAEFSDCTLAISKAAEAPAGCPRKLTIEPANAQQYGQRWSACSQSCAYPRCYICTTFDKVRGVIHPEKTYIGQLVCESGLLGGAPGTFYDWNIGFEAGFEAAHVSDDYGLNHWEIGLGLIPWLRDCHKQGLLKDLDGEPFDLNSAQCWDTLFRKITFREGIGDALAEGGMRAAKMLHLGEDIVKLYYTAWGFAGHWDGHGDKINLIVFPYWLVTALQWAMATRDPLSSGHGYAQNIMMWSPMRSPVEGLEWEEIAATAAMVYGSRDAAHPLSGYKDKAYPAIHEGHRSVFKDSLTVDDQTYPRIYSKRTPDHLARAGGMLGPSFEYHMFRLATGMDISEIEFEQMAERVVNQERALQIRNWDRSRQVDEQVIPYFATREEWVNPFVGEGQGLDVDQFRKLMDEYYQKRGWDVASGRPTRARLEMLGLKDVADELAARGLLP